MTAGGGGLNIPVGFDISAALAALDALRNRGGQTAQGMSAAFQSVNFPVSDNVRKAVEQLQAASKAADELKGKGEIRITLRGENVEQVRQAFEETSRTAQAMAGRKYALQLTVSGDDPLKQLEAVRARLNEAAKGSTFRLKLEVEEEDAKKVLQSLEADFKKMEAKGIKIQVDIDPDRARQNAAQAAAQAQAAADAQARKAKAAAAEEARQTQQAVNQVRVGVTIDGADTTAAQLRRLQTEARALNSVYRLTINAEGKNVNAEIERIRQALQGLDKGDAATINLNLKAPDAARVTRAIQADIEDLRRRGAKIDINLNPQQPNRFGQQVAGGAARGLVAGSGIGGNLLIGANFTAGAAAGLAAAVAVQALTQAIIASTQASIAYNSRLELTRNTFEFFTGSAEKAAAAMANLRRLAAQSPLSEQETLQIGASFLRITGGDVQQMQKLTELTTALASARPELGFERIQGAIQQLISGDFEAFDDRMNITVGTTRELARQGVSGFDLWTKAVEKAGGSLELMNKNSQSFEVRLSNLIGSIEGINAALGRGAFEGMSDAIGKANTVLADHQATWEKLAESIGRAAAASAGFGAKSLGLPDLGNIIKQLEAFIILVEKAQGKKPDVNLENEGAVAQRAALTTQRQGLEGEAAKEKKNLEDIERQLKANKAAQDVIKLPVEQRLVALRAELAQIQQINQELEGRSLQAQKALTEANMRRQAAQGDPEARADLAGEKFALDIEKEKLELQQRRAQRAEAITELEENMARRVREAELETRRAALDGLKDEIQQRQAARTAAIEAIREEMRARQEARQAALEAIREEIRARQEARQAALEALREEIRERQEARNTALEAMREEIRARQEARQAALDAVREEIRARQEARQAALEAIREEIRSRREAYDLALQQQRDIQDDAERNYQRAEEARDRQHRREQERYRDQIERLRERDQRITRQEQGKSPAERELEALEKQSRERQRLQSIADAEAAVYNARTGRERREAQRRLEQIRVEQAEERKKEELQARAEREKEQREEARAKRQEQIAALERKAQEEDRKYQKEKEQRELAHKQQQEALELARRNEERAEEARRREEDRQVREAEKAAKAQEKAEAAQLRELEKADREAAKAEAAAIRAQEQANRQQDRAEQAQIRTAEKAAREEEKADQARLREEERAAKAAERAEQAQVRAQEQAHREQERAEAARIRAEEQAIREAEKQERDRRAAEDAERDRVRLERLQKVKEIEDAIDENRRKTLELINVSMGQQAERDATLAELLAQQAENLKKLDELQKAIMALPIRAEMERIQAELGTKLVELEQERLRIEGLLNAAQTRLDDLKKQIDEVGKQITAITNPKGPDGQPTKPEPMSPEEASKTLARSAALFMEWIQKSWPQIIGEGVTKIVGGMAKALIDYFLSDNPALKDAATKWIDYMVKTPMERLIQVESPSKLTEQWAKWMGEGFVNGFAVTNPLVHESLLWPFVSFQDEYIPAFMEKFTEQMAAIQEAIFKAYEGQKIAEHLETPFIDFQDNYYPAFEQKLGTQIDGTVTVIRTKWEQAGIAASLEGPFIEFQELYMPAFIEKLKDQGEEAAKAFVDAWIAYDIEGKLTIKVDSSGGFKRFGQDAGEQFCEGWTTAMRGCPCPDCGPRTPNPKPGPNPKPEFGAESARTAGPSVGPFFPEAAVNVAASTAFGNRSVTNVAGSTSVRGPVSVQVSNVINGLEGESPESFAERITAQTIDRVIDVLDYTEATTPDTVSRGLPGAL